jgi:nitrite reductase/ring-hydroxylating ferredoxin subunit
MTWHKVDVDLNEGEHQGLEVSGEKVLICNVEGKLYATSNLCPHVGAVLSPGDLSEGQIACPFHNWTFDVRTGQCTFPEGGPELQIIPLRESELGVEIEV